MANQTKRADSRKLNSHLFCSGARDVSQAEEVAVIAAVLHLAMAGAFTSHHVAAKAPDSYEIYIRI